MIGEDGESKGAGKNQNKLLKLLVATVLFPLLWIAVTINFLGIAERLSFLPGISRNGGIDSGISAFLLSLALIGIIGGGAMLAMGGGSYADSNGDPVVPPSAQTPTATEIPTKTASKTETTPIPTTNRTPTPVHTREGPLEIFDKYFRERVNETWEREDLVDVPILGIDYRENDRGQTVMWVVFWQCDKAVDVKSQRQSIAAIYADTIAVSNESIPDVLRVYGVSEWELVDDYTTYITKTEAKQVINGSISRDTYLKTWAYRGTDPSQAMNRTAYRIAVNESGQAKADEAFYDDHEEQQGCPGAAESNITPISE